jgi:hypothetical protein
MEQLELSYAIHTLLVEGKNEGKERERERGWGGCSEDSQSSA